MQGAPDPSHSSGSSEFLGSFPLSGPPELKTARLRLRGLRLEDAPAVERLAGAAQIAATTLRIPHPYPPGAAEDFILGQEEAFARGTGVTFGIFEGGSGEFVGCVGLGCEEEHFRAELGYWIGVPYWGRGYATEAARQVVAFGFASFRLHRIDSRHFASNPASGRVLEKIGMRREGRRREAFFKAGRGFEDSVEYGLLSREWAEGVRAGRDEGGGEGR